MSIRAHLDHDLNFCPSRRPQGHYRNLFSQVMSIRARPKNKNFEVMSILGHMDHDLTVFSEVMSVLAQPQLLFEVMSVRGHWTSTSTFVRHGAHWTSTSTFLGVMSIFARPQLFLLRSCPSLPNLNFFSGLISIFARPQLLFGGHVHLCSTGEVRHRAHWTTTSAFC